MTHLPKWASTAMAGALALIVTASLVTQTAEPPAGGFGASEMLASEEGGRVPMLIWPIGRANGDGVFVQLGPDTDPASGAWEDWECYSQFTYDGHRGTDIMAYNFRIMDQGVPVLAAADGRVTWTQTGNFDRNYWTPYIGLPNGINIRHPDGSDSQYFHLRTHSVSVQVGDRVEAGQIIGYIGSSGSSPTPHLHFELWENGQTRDPNRGTCNNRSSLWLDTFDHPATTDLRILDWDIFVDTDLSGAENNNYLGDKRLKNRPFRPIFVGPTEEQLGVWVQVQGLTGAIYDVRVVDNDGNEFARTTKGVVFPRSVQWHALYFDFGADVSTRENPDGVWTVELLHDGHPVRTKTFNVGHHTQFPIRFFPLAGRSLKRAGGEVRDTLRVRHAKGTVQYRLVDAPAGVSLQGEQVIIGPSAEFPFRNGHFQVIATDEASLSDTMYYHVVSPGMPLAGATTTSLEGTSVPDRFRILDAYPNPFRQSMTLEVEAETAGEGRLTVHDVLGREVYRQDLGVLRAGSQSITLARSQLSPGTYLVEVRTSSGSARRAVTVL